ncbi:UDP-N-acetylmuramate dehydrogenase [Aliidiomarina minuta]|nr:UDP-N-acetylmuramate dehydrogenase [Aliidiomarina minuta]
MTALHNKHSFALKAEASDYLAIKKLSDLEKIVWTKDSWILGAGSNTVFTQNYAGQLIHNCLSGGEISETDDSYELCIASGENWHEWVTRTVRQGIPGLENLALIPGSVGAAPVQNIGAYGVEISRFVTQVDVYDLAEHRSFHLAAADCQFAYRDSIFKKVEHASWFITAVHLSLPKDWAPVLEYPDLQGLPVRSDASQVMQKVIEVRQNKLPDPRQIPNAGSFFKNPVVDESHLEQLLKEYPDIPYFRINESQIKLAAGWLIDQAGLKTCSFGGAGVHQKQALVLVNRGEATGDDVLQLAQRVRQEVNKKFAVHLSPEVRLLGEKGLLSL